MQQSTENKVLREFVRACDERALPEFLKSRRDNVELEYSELNRLRARSPQSRIYGLTTLPGHRDDEHPSESIQGQYQHKLIESHCVPARDRFPKEVGPYVTFAKAFSVAAGGSLISRDLYDIILSAAADRKFSPNIPRNATYSSGDVIPAAHWAAKILKRQPSYSLQPGEGMALINGAFVHMGVATWAFTNANRAWRKFLVSTQTYLKLVPCSHPDIGSFHAGERSLTEGAVKFAEAFARPLSSEQRQTPVSIRAVPQVIDGLATSLSNLASELNFYLYKPSGNPQIRKSGAGEYFVVPSGSFLLPSLSIQADAAISATLMAAWHVTRRMEYLLSGNVEGVARDGATADNPLGFIQWPKLATAKLESMRAKYTGGAFSSGGTTSYGIEDFWTHGVSVADQLAEASQDFVDILNLEFAVLTNHQDPDKASLAASSSSLTSRATQVPSGLSFL